MEDVGRIRKYIAEEAPIIIHFNLQTTLNFFIVDGSIKIYSKSILATASITKLKDSSSNTISLTECTIMHLIGKELNTG